MYIHYFSDSFHEKSFQIKNVVITFVYITTHILKIISQDSSRKLITGKFGSFRRNNLIALFPIFHCFHRALKNEYHSAWQRKCETHARAFSQTFEHGNSKDEIRRRNIASR